MRRGVLPLLVAAAAAALAAAPSSAGADEAALKDMEARYRKLARNKDDAANRERRKLLYALFEHRDLKPARKLLRQAWDDETVIDNKIAVVHVLGATGDAKEIDFLLGALKKERQPGPLIALGQALSYTDPAKAEAASSHVATLLPRQKGDALRPLLEGLGELGAPSAHPALAALGEKLPPAERFEQVIALGACGRAAAVPELERVATLAEADLRLAAALGLGRSGGPDQPPADAALPVLVRLVAASTTRSRGRSTSRRSLRSWKRCGRRRSARARRCAARSSRSPGATAGTTPTRGPRRARAPRRRSCRRSRGSRSRPTASPSSSTSRGG